MQKFTKQKRKKQNTQKFITKKYTKFTKKNIQKFTTKKNTQKFTTKKF